MQCLTNEIIFCGFASTLVLDCSCIPVCSSYNNQTAEQRTYSLSPPQGIFALQKSLRGGLRWGWGPQRSRQRHCPRKEISRGNLLCAKSGLTNLSYPRLESAQKYVTTPDWKNFCTGQPQGARGTAVPLFREESRGTPSKGSFGQLLRGGSTPRFFAQIRSVGSKNGQSGGLHQILSGAAAPLAA